MARANRHHLPGYVWHITHRCHKKEFLLKFEKDKNRWMKLIESHRRWVEEILKNGSNKRDAKWTESIAVGDKEFVLETKTKLGARAIGRKALEDNGNYELRESQTPYNPLFTPEKYALRPENGFFWDLSY